MKEISLTKNKIALIDDQDYPLVKEYSWHAYYSPHNQEWYGATKIGDRTIYMHRFIMDAPSNVEVDHINRNGLDNRRANLRLASRQQNSWNGKLRSGGTSIYRGVNWAWGRECWEAKIRTKDKRIWLGYFPSEIEAAKAYDNAAREYHGEFASLNFPEPASVGNGCE